MAKDVVNDSKWHAVNEGPFKVRRRNQGGAYELEGLDRTILPYKFPPEQLQLVPHFKAPEVASLAVRNIQDHRGLNESREYLARWMDPAVPAQWLPAASFDGSAMISKYLKARALKEKKYRSAVQALKASLPTGPPARQPVHSLVDPHYSATTPVTPTPATARALAASSAHTSFSPTASGPALASTSSASHSSTTVEASEAAPTLSPL